MSHKTKLNEIAEINPLADFRFPADAQCTFVPMEAVDDTLGEIVNPVTRPYKELAKGYTTFAENDVIVAKITPCMENGKCAIARNLRNGIAFGSTEFHVIRATKYVLPQWLYYLWRLPETRRRAERSMTGSAGQKRVPTSFLQSLDVPLPSVSQQRRISRTFEKADRLRRTRRYALEVTDTFLPAVFVQMFGDLHSGSGQRVNLEDVADILTGYPFPSEQYVTRGETVRLCRGANVLPNRIDWTDLVLWPRANSDYLSNFELKVGDVVVAMDRPWISEGFKVAQLSAEDCPSLLVQRVARLRGRDGVPSAFLYHLLKQPGFSGHCRPTETTLPHISPTDIKKYCFVLPPLPLQQEFAELAARHNRMRTTQVESLRQAEHLFQTLLHNAFKAES